MPPETSFATPMLRIAPAARRKNRSRTFLFGSYACRAAAEALGDVTPPALGETAASASRTSAPKLTRCDERSVMSGCVKLAAAGAA